MIIVLSPAKRLDFTPPPVAVDSTPPGLVDEAGILARKAKTLTRGDLKRLMDLSDDLADLNYERFQNFEIGGTDGAPAALAFAGDVYRGLDARSLTRAQLDWAQDHLRILSGLYGVLRPLDAIQPYRLEMGSRLPTARGFNLYEFWGDRIARALGQALDGQRDRTIVNLASQEYFRAVDAGALDAPVVAPVFVEESGVGARTIAVYAKHARGRMARWAIENRVTDPEALKEFDCDSYRFAPKQSTPARWVFTRSQPPKKS